MKNLKCSFFVCGILMLVQAHLLHAQIGVGIGLTSGTPSNHFVSESNLGYGIYLEPKYLLSNHIVLGATLSSVTFDDDEIAGVNAIPVLAFTEYIFLAAKVTPYAGMGLGTYFIKDAFKFTSDTRTEIGFAPRTGLLIGKFNFGGAYHIVKSANYVSFHLGVDIGARRSY